MELTLVNGFFLRGKGVEYFYSGSFDSLSWGGWGNGESVVGLRKIAQVILAVFPLGVRSFLVVLRAPL